ncbi:MAG TPA: GNAT family protein [Spirochaetia bacterium]|nr:GNAT family protein [Spirochaetia bacterium]
MTRLQNGNDGRIFLRFFAAEDAEQLLALHMRNRDFFRQFISTRSDNFYTLESQQDIVVRDERARLAGTDYSFGIFLAEGGELVGNVALTGIIRGALRSCFIGYFLDREENGKGYATEAVGLAVDYAFDTLKLHRIEAGVMPHNIRSMRVLEKCGFRKEGIARKSVEIDGVWQDHQMLAILSDDR